MDHIVQLLHKKHIPVSQIRAVQFLNERNWSEDEYKNWIAQASGLELEFVSQKEAKYTHMYFIQDFLLNGTNGVFSIKESVLHSKAKASTFVSNFKWSWESDDPDQEDGNKTNVLEAVQDIYKEYRHELNRQDMIEMIEKEVEVKRTTLYSYLSTCRKKFGPCKDWKNEGNRKSKTVNRKDIFRQKVNLTEPKTRHQWLSTIKTTLDITDGSATAFFYSIKAELNVINGKGSPNAKKSKLQVATEIVKNNPDTNKKDILDKIVEQTGTTIKGANTYYCKAKKELTQ